jgi:hypothetical protein
MVRIILYIILFYVIYKALEKIIKAVASDKDKRDYKKQSFNKNEDNKIIDDDKGDFVDYEEVE